MLEALGKLLGVWFGNPIRGLVTVMLSSIIILALWQFQPFRETMKDPFLRWPFLALIVSVTGLVTYPAGSAWKARQVKRHEAASAKKCVARLNNLTPHEKKVLRRYLEEQTTAHNWGKGGGTVDVLARDGVLSLIWTDPDIRRNLVPDTYAMNEVAWRHLNAHPELIDLERRP
jgi:hypothetical protein